MFYVYGKFCRNRMKMKEIEARWRALACIFVRRVTQVFVSFLSSYRSIGILMITIFNLRYNIIVYATADLIKYTVVYHALVRNHMDLSEIP
jgi:hypothetical protein